MLRSLWGIFYWTFGEAERNSSISKCLQLKIVVNIVLVISVILEGIIYSKETRVSTQENLLYAYSVKKKAQIGLHTRFV